MTKETAEFLFNILAQVSISAKDPDIEVSAKKIVQARKELAEILGSK